MKNNSKKLAAILAGSVMMAACYTSPAYAETKALTIGSGQSCSTLDVNHAYDAWYQVRYGVCQTLTKMNDDMTISGWLTEDDYEASEDYKVWTFHIKEGVTFSNGNPMDAEAVKNSLMNVFENGTRGPEYFTPASIEADGLTLTITCEQSEPILPNKLADPLFCIIDTTQDLSNIVEEGPIGTGPFVTESFDDVTKECVVVKNENYWNGEVKMDQITFYYTEDQATLTMALEAGEVDAVYNLSMTDMYRFEGQEGYQIVRTASGRTTHGFMNQNGLLGNDTLRQAILMSLDKETYCSVLLNDQYVAGKTLITSSADYGYEELTDPYAFDPEGAVALLDEAGITDSDGDGIRELDGEPIVLEYVYYQGRPEQQVVVEATQLQLAELGIQVNITVNDTSTVIDRLAAGDFDMLCMSINVLNCADPENHMNTYFKTGGSYQNYGWSNETFDALMEELRATGGEAERISIVKEAEQILLDDAVCIYYCYPLMNFVMTENVSGITSTPADYYWVSEETDIVA